ncbi:NUDIX hydrolase [Dermacoccaceae bacterium W4C1]
MTSTTGTTQRRSIAAAGALPWRREGGELQVALVHRPRYDDWSWPKGKLDKHESWPGAARREVSEETGLQVRLGAPLPSAGYPLSHGEVKEVRYWSAVPIGGSGDLDHEVDQVRWVEAPTAAALLTHPRDTIQLDALVAADELGHLDTWPLLVVRHAEAIGRGRWSSPDHERPLDAHGRAQAAALIPLLDAYAPQRVITSPAERCLTTIAPYAHTAKVPVRTKNGLSEEGFADDPTRVLHHLEKALHGGRPIALCTHRPLLPSVLLDLAARADTTAASTLLRLRAHEGLAKGEVAVAHVRGIGEDAVVVAAETHSVA